MNQSTRMLSHIQRSSLKHCNHNLDFCLTKMVHYISMPYTVLFPLQLPFSLQEDDYIEQMMVFNGQVEK